MAKNQYTNYDCHKLESDFYKTLLSLGAGTDFVYPEGDLSRYKIIIAPSLMLVSGKTAENLKKYVAGGGCLVVHVRAGQRDTDNVMVDTPWPGLLRELCGITVDEFEAFPDNVQNTVVYQGKTYPVRWWADVMTADTAVPEAVYGDRFYKGSPAITVNRFGRGRALYFGAAGCIELIGDYLKDFLRDCGIKTISLPEKIFMSKRKSDETSYAFILNMGDRVQEFDPGIRGRDILSGKEITGKIQMKPLEIIMAETNDEYFAEN
jgi:beta-galactosidase